MDLWDHDAPASHLNGTDYEEFIFLQRIFDIIDHHNAEEDDDDNQVEMFEDE